MKHTYIRLGAIGATVGTSGILMASSVASAMSMSSATINNNVTQSMLQNKNSLADDTTMSNQGGSSMTTGNTDRGSPMRLGHAWGLLNPHTMNGQGSVLPNNLLTKSLMSLLGKLKMDWSSTGSNPTWTPSGTNWQANWANWNPVLWEQNGSTFANWSSQLASYLNTRFPSLAPELSAIGL